MVNLLKSIENGSHEMCTSDHTHCRLSQSKDRSVKTQKSCDLLLVYQCSRLILMSDFEKVVCADARRCARSCQIKQLF